MSYDTEALGVVPSLRLLRDLSKIPEAKHFVAEYHALLQDDCAEYDRQLTLLGATTTTTTTQKTSPNQTARPVAAIIPLAQYMLVPLSLVRLVATDDGNCDLLDYLKQQQEGEHESDDNVEEKFAKLFPQQQRQQAQQHQQQERGSNKHTAKPSCSFKPLQVVFRAPLPTTTYERRRVQREKFKVARAHQEREAYNRMLRGSYQDSAPSSTFSTAGKLNNHRGEGDSTQTVTERLIENVFFKKQIDPKADPAGASSSMRLKASSGGAGFLARDAFSSSSRQEMEAIAGITQHDSQKDGGDSTIRKISRDVGLGLDVPLMALAGAVVGWYACSLRGFSANESAIGAAVCATVMLIVDAGLVMMKLAREDLQSMKEKKRREEELRKAVKASTVTNASTTSISEATAASSSTIYQKKPSAYRVLSREVVGDVPPTNNNKHEESKKEK